MKTLVSVTIYGQLIGKVWDPPEDYIKNFRVKFINADNKFFLKWEGLKNALDYICNNDVDFKSTGKILNGQIEVVWRDKLGNINTGGKNIPICKLTRKYFYPMSIDDISKEV